MYDERTSGFHIISDLWGCKPTYLEKEARLKELLLEAARQGDFHVVDHCFHQFNPRGATGVVLLELSHISAHSWPELDFIAIDIYSCGSRAKARKAMDYLLKALKPKRIQMREVERFR